MKKFIFCLFAAFALLGTSCSKSNDDEPVGSATATVEGKTFNFSDVEWTASEVSKGTYLISSLSEESTPKEIMIRLGAKKTGDIIMDNSNSVSITVDGANYHSASGTISVTAFDENNINGTFTGKFFKGINNLKTYDITGSFISTKTTTILLK